jgi:thiamine-monophosphate kinase
MLHFNITKNKEQQFVEKFALPLTLGSPFARNLTDDVALLEGMICKTDSLCEGIHCKIGTSPEKMGHKLLARALSDVASKGGFPKAFMLSIFKTQATNEGFLAKFLEGTRVFDIPLIGGDVASSLNQNFSANVSVFAKSEGKIPHRDGAKEGDFIYITGKIGRAYLGFLGNEKFIDFYEKPLPKLALMQEICQKHNINASIDISDGFMKDLLTLLVTSNLGAQIDFLKIPLIQEKFAQKMMTFGDDYEIIFTSKEEIHHPEVVKIGFIKKEKLLSIENARDIKFKEFGYTSL